MDIKGQIDVNAIIMGDFSTPLSQLVHKDEKNQQRNIRVKPHHWKKNGLNKYLQGFAQQWDTHFS